MTEEQIEAAAIELCRIREVFPAVMERRPRFESNGKVVVVDQTRLAWAKEEVRAFLEVGTALAAVAALPGMKPLPKRRSVGKGLRSDRG